MNTNILRKLNSLIRIEIIDILYLRSEIAISIRSNITIEKKKLIPIVKL